MSQEVVESGLTARPMVTAESHRFNKIGEIFRSGLSILDDDARILASRTSTVTNLSAASKVTIIVLGAIVATSGTMSAVFGEDNDVVILMYAFCGVVIAAVGGIDAAFRLQELSSGVRHLGGEIEAKRFSFYSSWLQLQAELEDTEAEDSDSIETIVESAKNAQ
jgi:hypothetical protein